MIGDHGGAVRHGDVLILAALRVVLVPLVRRVGRVAVLSRASLILHIAMYHGAHRLIQTLLLRLLMLSVKLNRAPSTTIIMMHSHRVSQYSTTLTSSSTHDHGLTRRGWQLGCIVAA